MRRSASASIVTVASAALIGSLTSTPAGAEVVVNISKSQQQLAVIVDGAERHRWPVSTGSRRYETPNGEFRPIRLERKWYSRKYNWTPMPYSIFFHRGYAVHGTTEKRNLGRAVSHGCVRLLPANASTLFSLVRAHGKANARIVVLDGPLPGLPASPNDHIAKADGAAAEVARAGDGQLSAKTTATAKPPKAEPAAVPLPAPVIRDAARRAPPPQRMPARIDRVAADRHFTAAGDEAAVLRGREAWLRSLDRKYGIAR